MSTPTSRTHLINRLSVVGKNLKATPDNSTQDKRISRLVDKIEHMMKGRAEISAYRKIRNAARASAEEQLLKEAADKVLAEQNDATEDELMSQIEDESPIPDGMAVAESENVGVS